MKNEKAIAIMLAFLFFAGGFGFIPGLTNAQDEEKVIKLGIIGDPENLNPVMAWTELAWILIEWMYEPLVRWDLSGGTWKIVPGLAESWEWAANGTQCTFHLVQNATWHDGTPITAADVNWTFFTTTWLDWWEASTSHVDHNAIKVLDDYTVVLNFVENGYPVIPKWDSIWDSTPYYYIRDVYNDTPVAISQDYFLFSTVYMPIFPKHIWDPLMWNDPVFGVNSPDYYGTYNTSAPYNWIPLSFWDAFWYDGISWGTPTDLTVTEPRIGSGPFIFDEWIPGESLRFVANEDYHWGAPNIDAIELIVYSTLETMTQGVVSGDIDICETSIIFTELSEFGPNIEVVENEFMGYRSFFVNQYEPYLNASAEYDGRGPKHNALLENAVRKAIHQAIDKERIADVAYLGTARAADSVIHDTLPWHNDNIVKFTEGTAAAIATLEAAGWTKNAEDLWQKEIDGVNETLSFTLKYVAGSPVPFTEAQLLKEDLELAGFDITTIPVESTTFVQDATTGTWNFDLLVDFWTQLGDPNYYMFYLRPTSALNPNNMEIPRIEELFNLQQTTADEAARKVYVDEFQQIVYDDSSAIPLVYYKDVEIYRSDRWVFTETDWHSGIYAIPNYKAWLTVDVAPEPTTTTTPPPPPPVPMEMIVLVAGAAVIIVVIFAVIYMKRK
ncbi:MAG: ABC transporter substrate-binding protein [Candidatus Thorarchaeota archaeon]